MSEVDHNVDKLVSQCFLSMMEQAKAANKCPECMTASMAIISLINFAMQKNNDKTYIGIRHVIEAAEEVVQNALRVLEEENYTHHDPDKTVYDA